MSPIDLLDAAEVGRRIAAWRHTHPAFDTLMRRYADPARTLRHFGLTLWAERDFDLSIAVFTTALSVDRNQARLWSDLAGVLNAAGRNLPARSAVETAIALDPNEAGAWLLLATLSSDAEDFDTAEAAFGKTLALNPALADAHFGLGILYFNRRQFAPAAESLRRAVALGNGNANSLTCLGHVLYLTAEFPDCVAAFEAAGRLQPLDPSSRRKFARASMMVLMSEGGVAEGLARYAAIAGEHAEDMHDVTRDAFALLSAHGHLAAAAEVGDLRLARDPNDHVQRYLLEAVRGVPLDSAPADYLETLFNKFAKGFDKQLVGTLRYNVPEELQALVAAAQGRFSDMLDLGCGTGLAAAFLRRFGGRLTGLDISGGMLEEADKRALYDALVKAEAIDFLARHAGAFDLVFAADMLVYCGDLAPLMDKAATALRAGGILAASVEALPQGDFRLLPSGRFAHGRSYIERLAAPAFEIMAFVDSMIRLEANRPVDGYLFVLRRR